MLQEAALNLKATTMKIAYTIKKDSKMRQLRRQFISTNNRPSILFETNTFTLKNTGPGYLRTQDLYLETKCAGDAMILNS